jgi:GNAT superfamily N-acetyltransferase
MLRPATADDAEAIHAVAASGFETYRSFAAEGWEPPEEGMGDVRERLSGPDAWGVVFEEDGAVVAVGAYEAARDPHRTGPIVPGLAHVWAVFAARSHWGTGAATTILAALVDHAREAGFSEARLYTPAGQARARRFYVREGWTEVGEPFMVEALGLDLVELRRPL